MKDALGKFLVDLVEGGAAGAAIALQAFDLNTATAKVVLAAVLVGAVNGVIAAARRYALARLAKTAA